MVYIIQWNEQCSHKTFPLVVGVYDTTEIPRASARGVSFLIIVVLFFKQFLKEAFFAAGFFGKFF